MAGGLTLPTFVHEKIQVVINTLRCEWHIARRQPMLDAYLAEWVRGVRFLDGARPSNNRRRINYAIIRNLSCRWLSSYRFVKIPSARIRIRYFHVGSRGRQRDHTIIKCWKTHRSRAPLGRVLTAFRNLFMRKLASGEFTLNKFRSGGIHFLFDYVMIIYLI